MKTRNRIAENDTIKASSYTKDGKLITSLYDSGFNSISQVIARLKQKGAGQLKNVYEVRILNEDKQKYGYYTNTGRLKF